MSLTLQDVTRIVCYSKTGDNNIGLWLWFENERLKIDVTATKAEVHALALAILKANKSVQFHNEHYYNNVEPREDGLELLVEKIFKQVPTVLPMTPS